MVLIQVVNEGMKVVAAGAEETPMARMNTTAKIQNVLKHLPPGSQSLAPHFVLQQL
jgi:hypothetical protein